MSACAHARDAGGSGPLMVTLPSSGSPGVQVRSNSGVPRPGLTGPGPAGRLELGIDDYVFTDDAGVFPARVEVRR